MLKNVQKVSQEGRKEETEGRRKVTAIQSILAKILLLVAGIIVAVTVINLGISIPMVRSNVSDTIKDYMSDLAKISGENIDREVDFAGAEAILTADELGKMLKGTRVEGFDSSYAYVVAADGTMLYHPTAEKIGQPVENDAVKQLLGQLAAGTRPETDVITYVFKSVNKYAAFYVGQNKDYILIVTADEKEAFASVNKIMTRNILGAVVALIICCLLSVVISSGMIRPIVKITEELSRLSELDLTDNGQLEAFARRKDETGAMAQAAMVLRGKLNEVIKGIIGQSKELYTASENMNAGTVEINRSVEQVEKAVTEIADGATSQAQETQTATENIIVIGDMISETNSEVEDLRITARSMRSSGEKASEILAELKAINQQTKDAIQIISDQTSRTNDSVVEIRKATDIITDIAEETNLLSLNASIEAARAGEAGRGFAVVASQIQQLADQSNISANQINKTISSLITEFEETMKTMEAVKRVIARQDDDVAHTEAAFKEVSNGISKSIDGIRAIAGKTARLDEARVRIVDVVQNLTAIAEQNAASTEETSATASEVSAIMEDVAENAGQLQLIANGLDESVRNFRFDE